MPHFNALCILSLSCPFHRYRFPTMSFGLWWALMSLSYFLVNLVGPSAATSWANDHGWRVAIQMPAVISMVIASALYFLNIDKPSDVGYQNQKYTQGKGRVKYAPSTHMRSCLSITPCVNRQLLMYCLYGPSYLQ